MNGNKLVTDTNILVYLLDGDRRLIDLLEDKVLFLSFITEIELLSSKSLKETERNIINKLFAQSNIIDINSGIKTNAIHFRSKYSLKIPDAIIAATSAYLNLPLLTSDSDFKRIEELSLLYFER